MFLFVYCLTSSAISPPPPPFKPSLLPYTPFPTPHLPLESCCMISIFVSKVDAFRFFVLGLYITDYDMTPYVCLFNLFSSPSQQTGPDSQTSSGAPQGGASSLMHFSCVFFVNWLYCHWYVPIKSKSVKHNVLLLYL